MALHLHVDRNLETLADRLAAFLSEQPADPFQPELVLVPSAGIRTWLTHGLATRLGVTAHIEFAFPGSIIQRSINADQQLGLWSTNRLMWGIFHLMSAGDPSAGEPDLARARRIADLFDRYTNHRPAMVLQWSNGRDVDALDQPLPEGHRWQPALWRSLETHYGQPCDARLLKDRVDDLAADSYSLPASVPERVSLFGMTPASAAQLWALRALAAPRTVYVFAPTPSAARWASIADSLSQPLIQPTARARITLGHGAHPLLDRWGRNPLEGLAMFESLRIETEGSLTGPTSPSPAPTTLLGRLQHDLDQDLKPDRSATAPDEATTQLVGDGSVVWHQTYGGARQIETLRDQILHLLCEQQDGVQRFQPRDIAVLCPDIATAAPLIEAVFAGDPDHGVPAIPVAIADRSVASENPFALAATTLAGLTEGRFRFEDLFELLSNPVVAARLAFTPEALSRAHELLADAGFRWGITPEDQARFGFAPLGIHTLHDALNRLMVSAITDTDQHRLILGSIAPVPSSQLSDLALLGTLARAAEQVTEATRHLRQATTLETWVAALRTGLRMLTTTADHDASDQEWVDHELASLVEEASWNGEVCQDLVASDALARLVDSRLRSNAGRTRFGTGRITISSLAAQRGVPFPVICILGLDAANETGSFSDPDDLVVSSPSLGDSDHRSERRAQLLDAINAAGERMIICSTGFDLNRSEPLPTSTLLVELDDLVLATTGEHLPAIAHPRQAWARSALSIDGLGTGHLWSFDQSALAAATARIAQLEQPLPKLSTSQPPHNATDETAISLDELSLALTDPAKLVATRRLGIAAPGSLKEANAETIELSSTPLERWELIKQALTVAITGESLTEWAATMSRSGIGAPGGFGSPDLAQAVLAGSLAREVLSELGADDDPLHRIPIDCALRCAQGTLRVSGSIGPVVGNTVFATHASRSRNHHLLVSWLHLLLLHTQHPETNWSAVVISRDISGEKLLSRTMTLHETADVAAAVTAITALWDQASQRPVPFFADLSATRLATLQPELPKWLTNKAKQTWEKGFSNRGERQTGHNPLFFDETFDQLIKQTDLDDWAQAVYLPMITSVDVVNTILKADDALAALANEVHQWA
jgi:exodeoxyribonuclease V gamma subunit